MRTKSYAISAVVALAVLIAGCPKTEGPAQQAPMLPEPVKKAISTFGEKPYVVCDEGKQDVHSDMKFKGAHLKVGEEVLFSTSGPGLKAKLGGHQIDVTASEDGSELRGEGDFEHQSNEATDAAQAATMLAHQVRIVKSTHYEAPLPPAEGCNPEKNIIDIEFCTKSESGEWQCADPNAHHQGDVHAQN